jgi:peptidoglycan/xylan/chitin deacetylase (PgdA/CDA1 family)
MFLNSLYYKLKPLIPRRLQIEIRRQIVLRKRVKYAHVWPIDQKAAKPPEGWTGWPEGKKFALVLTHDVETAVGQDKCLKLIELEKSLGFRSSFNFIVEEYRLFPELRRYLEQQGFEVGIHGLHHNVNLFKSKTTFQESAKRINLYLKEWKSVGFRAPSMYHNLDWIGDLDIEYDSSTFDTDPFEPQPDGVGTIFPFWVPLNPQHSTLNTELKDSRLNTQHLTLNTGYVELPYTLPQDHCLFVIMGEKNIDIWKQKLDWIAEHGGMALLITHPDYMNFEEKKDGIGEYPMTYFTEFLEYIKNEYKDQYWNALPKEMASFWAKNYVNKKG